MNHLTLRGTHREMGFQWGARLAERGLRLLDHVPFFLTAERRAFAAACHPAYARHFPAALEELEQDILPFDCVEAEEDRDGSRHLAVAYGWRAIATPSAF